MSHRVDFNARLSPNFIRHEFACKCGCGFATPDPELLEVLERIRKEFNAPVTINSACRCANHNKNVGGASNSTHLFGLAADIDVKGVKPEDVGKMLNYWYRGKYGRKAYDTFTHIDVREDYQTW